MSQDTPKGAHCELDPSAAEAFGEWLVQQGHQARVVTRVEVHGVTGKDLESLWRQWADSPPPFGKL